MKRIAVVLCGSGYKDGSEVRESVGVLWALSQVTAEVHCFAPNEAQRDVVNCLTGDAVPNEKRNMLTEAARIARGKVAPLETLEPQAFHGIIIPGGFGVARNLCTFAIEGSAGTVHPQLKKILTEFKAEKKPIGAICIAPAVLALAFKGENLELTVGADSEVAHEIQKLGHTHIPTQPYDFHVDKKNNIFSTPAYMYDNAPLHQIFMGIQGLVNDLVGSV